MLFRSRRDPPADSARPPGSGPCRASGAQVHSVRRRSGDRRPDRKSTRLNSSHTEIYTLSLHDALPISARSSGRLCTATRKRALSSFRGASSLCTATVRRSAARSEEHTSELQSHRDLHSFPTRCSSDLGAILRQTLHGHPEAGLVELQGRKFTLYGDGQAIGG